MKVGDKVVLLDDMKLSRVYTGIVVKQHNEGAISVLVTNHRNFKQAVIKLRKYVKVYYGQKIKHRKIFFGYADWDALYEDGYAIPLYCIKLKHYPYQRKLENIECILQGLPEKWTDLEEYYAESYHGESSEDEEDDESN